MTGASDLAHSTHSSVVKPAEVSVAIGLLLGGATIRSSLHLSSGPALLCRQPGTAAVYTMLTRNCGILNSHGQNSRSLTSVHHTAGVPRANRQRLLLILQT